MNNPLTELETALAHFRLSPEPCDEHLEELRQQYEDPLAELWALAFPKASTDSLTRSGADSCSSANQQLEKD